MRVAVAGDAGRATMVVLPRGVGAPLVLSFELGAITYSQGGRVATGRSDVLEGDLWLRIAEPGVRISDHRGHSDRRIADTRIGRWRTPRSASRTLGSAMADTGE